jgi:acetate kinase
MTRPRSVEERAAASACRACWRGRSDHSPTGENRHALIAELERAIPFAPLHLPVELRAIAAVRAWFSDVPQVVCFDTGFHRTLPDVASRFALPHAWFEVGIRRYGFHGLSFEYIAASLSSAQLRRAIFAHLGNGASMVAVRDGRSIDTTMGLTPTGGLVMGTRSGDLDPGLLIYLHLANLAWRTMPASTRPRFPHSM